MLWLIIGGLIILSIFTLYSTTDSQADFRKNRWDAHREMCDKANSQDYHYYDR